MTHNARLFRPLLAITGICAALLGCVLLIAPQLYLSLYVGAAANGMDFAAQRLAPAIIGLGALMWAARDLPNGRFAARFALIAGTVWFMIAGTGVYHFATGIAGFAILVAAASEVFLGLLFVLASRQIRHG